MEEKTTGILHPTTFNYATTCAAFNLMKTGDPKVFIIDYKIYELQKRLPGGRFRCVDVINAVTEFLSQKDPNSYRKLQFFLIEAHNLNAEYEKLTLRVEQARENEEFNIFTEKLLKKFQATDISEEEFGLILRNTHFHSAKRELREEIKATRVGKVYLTSVSNGGVHYKMGFVTVDVEAPPFYEGSADPKVLRSYETTVNEFTQQSLFNGHASRFGEAIRVIIQKRLHSNANDLKPFWVEAM